MPETADRREGRGGRDAPGGHGEGRDAGPPEAMVLVAGLADLAFSGLGAALRGARDVLRRADLAELARDGRQELGARGRLALRRYAVPEPHLEVLARRVDARSGGTSDG